MSSGIDTSVFIPRVNRSEMHVKNSGLGCGAGDEQAVDEVAGSEAGAHGLERFEMVAVMQMLTPEGAIVRTEYVVVFDDSMLIV
jgi:hypothetical protein